MDIHIIGAEASRLLSEIRSAISAASAAVIRIGVAANPTAAIRALHEAITRAEDALRTLREFYPIPDAD